MPSKIRVLDEHTINKIAAGEVIENPSSVVKELVENALDAGSTDICIEIKGGGRQLIRITDNGCGMNQDDALLCLERHATSKIRDVEDIDSIGTMGFRGEAIPSIAAISKFTLITADETSGMGTMLIVEGGKVLQCCSAARSQGTTIEVKSLFFNVPVRRKFQKSPAYDANEILKVISSIALGYPLIKFQLISDQKTVLSTPDSIGTSFQELLGERISEILGAGFLDSTFFAEGSEEGYRLQGFIGLPAFTRHNRTGQYLFINQRAIFSPLINFSVREGYGTTLSSNRHPVFVLHLTIPGSVVDVNVHPQKREVRLRQEQILKEMIVKAISKALQGKDTFVEEVNIPPMWNMETFGKPPVPSHPYNAPSFKESPFQDAIIEFKPASPVRSEQLSYGTKSVEPKIVSETLLPFSVPEKRPSPKVLSTIKHYMLIDGSLSGHNDGLSLADQRAVHARIIYEKLQKHALQKLEVQTLLIPYTFDTTPIESALLLESLEALNQIGLSIRQSGPNTFIVDAIPQIFGNSDMRALLSEIMQSVREYRDPTAFKKEHERQIAMAASRAAISSNRRLSVEEAQSLMDQLMQCESPYQCPFGKSTMVHLSSEQLSEHFDRRNK